MERGRAGNGSGEPEARQDPRIRHARMGWFEWSLRELLRYLYGLGVLAVVVMGPLQMVVTWLPPRAPPIVGPGPVGAVAITFVASVLYLSALGYRYVWGKGGVVDRAVRDREAALGGGTDGDGPGTKG